MFVIMVIIPPKLELHVGKVHDGEKLLFTSQHLDPVQLGEIVDILLRLALPSTEARGKW